MTNTTVSAILKNAIVTKTTELNGETKTREIQQSLKSTNFTERKYFTKYNNLCNIFIQSFEKYANEAQNTEKAVSKTTLLNKLNDISAALRGENVNKEGKQVTFKNYHVNYIINHATQIKINGDKTIADNIKSETAVRKLIEQCFYFELNNLPLPNVTISEKSLERIGKITAKAAEIEQNEKKPPEPKKDNTANKKKPPEPKKETTAKKDKETAKPKKANSGEKPKKVEILTQSGIKTTDDNTGEKSA